MIFGKWLTPFFLLIGLSLSASAGAYKVFDDEVLPWPWGSECPFPWESIEGEWSVRSASGANWTTDRFSFKVISANDDGSHFFQLLRLNEAGEVVAKGRGNSPSQTRIIWAAMIDVNPEGVLGEQYWAIVRAYDSEGETSARSCKKQVTTVITLRPIRGGDSEDVHLILQKEQKGEETLIPKD